MFADAYRGRGVSRFMCTYALTLTLMVSCIICRNLTFPSFKKRVFVEKWLFLSNEINFCYNEISLF